MNDWNALVRLEPKPWLPDRKKTVREMWFEYASGLRTSSWNQKYLTRAPLARMGPAEGGAFLETVKLWR